MTRYLSSDAPRGHGHYDGRFMMGAAPQARPPLQSRLTVVTLAYLPGQARNNVRRYAYSGAATETTFRP